MKKARIKDLRRIKQITARAYKFPYRKEKPVVTKPCQKDFAELFVLKKVFALVVFASSGKIVAAVKYKFNNKKEVYLFQLAVLKRYRNRGLGALLIEHLEKIAGKENCQNILLYCIKEKGLVEYYQKMGYKIEKEEKNGDYCNVYFRKKI